MAWEGEIAKLGSTISILVGLTPVEVLRGQAEAHRRAAEELRQMAVIRREEATELEGSASRRIDMAADYEAALAAVEAAQSKDTNQ